MSHNDWMPTLCAIAGEPDIVGKLQKGYNANGKSYKVHLDGFDQSAFLRGTTPKSARNKFLYSDDDGLLVGMRLGPYKMVFAEQRVQGTMQVWAEPFTELRLQKMFNLYMDPFERADITSNTYWDWIMDHVYIAYYAIAEVGEFAESLKTFPPRSIPPSFSPQNLVKDAIKEIQTDKEIRKVMKGD